MLKKMKRTLSKHVMGKEEELDISFIDSVLQKLLNLTEAGCQQLPSIVSGSQLKTLCKAATPILLAEPNLLSLKAPIKVVGDIHGQYFDLLRIFRLGGYPPSTRYVFLGDYVDRGAYGIEVLALLLIYKIKYPESIHLVRGNHECDITSKIYGFCDQCVARYSYRLWERFCMVFDVLPVAATIGPNFFCVHGGLSPLLERLDQIDDIPRPGKVLDGSLLSDLVWSDPEMSHKGWLAGKRGISGTFGIDMIRDFLSKNGFVLIIRGHQVAQHGYEFFGDDQELVTVFSAPNYCGTRNNCAAVMTITNNDDYHFDVLKPVMGANNRDSIDTVYGGAKAKFGDSDDKAVEFLEAGEMEDLPPPLCSADSAVLEDRIKDVMKQRIDDCPDCFDSGEDEPVMCDIASVNRMVVVTQQMASMAVQDEPQA